MLLGIVPQAKVLTFQDSLVFSSLFAEWVESFCLPSQETLFPLTYFFASIKFLHTLCIPFPYCCSKYDTSLSFLPTNVGTAIWASWVHFFNRKKRKDKKKKIHVLLGISASKISSEDRSCIRNGWPELWAWQYVNFNTWTVFSDPEMPQSSTKKRDVLSAISCHL